ncbi:glycoside hydrolase family 36 N-terminal domain-containing protein [Streptomyces sp. NPDC041068]|uniref:glycoside hydrolase family 36 N-terminal domain-containing protein n=1 Tax=Streptomyces sp. NPDC041068 TaxID=3155130 RepID=UPI00340BC4C7
MVEVGEDGRTWLLSGPTSSYALRLTERDELRHLYWGPRIALADAQALAAEREFASPLANNAEYPFDIDSHEWRYYNAAVNDDELQVHFRDAPRHLQTTLAYRLRGDVIERYAVLVHEGDHRAPDVELPRTDSGIWNLPRRGRWRLSQLHGGQGGVGARSWSRLVRSDLAYGEQVIGGRGRAGHPYLPWVALDAEGADEESGEVYSCALAWTEPWRIAVRQLPDGAVQITGGAGYDGFGARVLEPRTAIVAPVFAGLWSGAGFGGASRAWHAYQREHVLPDADEVRPVLYEAQEAAGPGLSEERQRALAVKAAELGVELFVVDGTYGGPEGELGGPEGTYGGLRALADAVHALGMRFGVRVELEAVDPDGGLSLADVHVRLRRRLRAVLAAAPVDHVTWDDPVARREHADDLLHRLRTDHPAVTFQPGWGGGRGDLDALSRHGLGQLYPAHMLATRVNDRAGSLSCRFVSAMAGALGIGADLTHWCEDELAEARDWVELHKEIRPVVQFGDLYRLRPPNGGLSAVQYVIGDHSVVLALLSERAQGEEPGPLRLRGLDPAAVYSCADTGESYRGAVLLHRGLRTGLGGDADAAVFRLRRLFRLG